MPIISKVGRKSFKPGLLVAIIYAVLILGGATMVFPFALMLSISISGDTDYRDYNIFPRYLFDNHALLSKYLYQRHNADIRFRWP